MAANFKPSFFRQFILGGAKPPTKPMAAAWEHEFMRACRDCDTPEVRRLLDMRSGGGGHGRKEGANRQRRRLAADEAFDCDELQNCLTPMTAVLIQYTMDREPWGTPTWAAPTRAAPTSAAIADTIGFLQARGSKALGDGLDAAVDAYHCPAPSLIESIVQLSERGMDASAIDLTNVKPDNYMHSENIAWSCTESVFYRDYGDNLIDDTAWLGGRWPRHTGRRTHPAMARLMKLLATGVRAWPFHVKGVGAATPPPREQWWRVESGCHALTERYRVVRLLWPEAANAADISDRPDDLDAVPLEYEHCAWHPTPTEIDALCEQAQGVTWRRRRPLVLFGHRCRNRRLDGKKGRGGDLVSRLAATMPDLFRMVVMYI